MMGRDGGAMREPVIGIDLGTTYSAVAIMEEGRPRIIPNRSGLRLTPSMIAFTRAGERVVGEAARVLLEEIPENVAYALQQKFEGRALVFDLGGGTFDVSILEVEGGVFQVRATGGDPRLGGEDFDNAIAQWLLAQVPEAMRAQVSRDIISMQHLKVAAERAKRTLTDHEEAYISVVDLGYHLVAKRFTELNTSLTRSF